MNTNPVSPIIRVGTMLTALFLALPCSHAQTFRGNDGLTANPKTFDATLYPVTTRPQTIRINFDNPGGKSVRVVIRHENGKVMYDADDNATASRAYYDLSPLPAGNYTVELTAGSARISKAFTMEPARPGFITMGTRPMPITGEFITADWSGVKKTEEK